MQDFAQKHFAFSKIVLALVALLMMVFQQNLMAQTILGTIAPTTPAGCKMTFDVCSGDTIRLRPTDSVNYTNFKWYAATVTASNEIDGVAVAAGNFNVLSSSVLPIILIRTPGTAQTLTFIITAEHVAFPGCSAKQDTIELHVRALPTVAIAETDASCTADDGKIILGDTATLTATAGFVSYVWENSLGTGNPKTLNPIATTTYSVRATDANGCTATANSMVTVVEVLSLSTNVTNVTCNRPSGGAIDVTVSGGSSPYTFDWGDIAGINNVEDRTNLTAGTYNLTVTDANNCSISLTKTLAPVVCDSSLIANRDDVTTTEDTPILIAELLNDTATNTTIDPTSVTIIEQPRNGRVIVNPTTGELTYTPNLYFSGKDTLIYQVCSVGMPPSVKCDTALVVITVIPSQRLAFGNLVWLDTNNDGHKNANEPGLPNIEVILYSTIDNIKGNSDDIQVDTLITDANGNYLFTGLTAGNYYVKLARVPDSLVSSTGGGIYDKDGAGDYEPSTVGDINEQDHGTGITNKMVISQIVNIVINGEPTNDGDSDPNTNLTVDFGLFVPRDTPIFDLALIKRLEPRPYGVVVNNGNIVRFNMTVFNQGNTNAYDVKISDYIPVGLEYQTALNTAAQTGNVHDWLADSTIVVGSVPVGQSVTVGIYFIVNHLPQDTIFANKSEILFATSVEGSGINTPDIDSKADKNPNNDIVGGENIINNYRNDEDDHDYAYVLDYIDHDPIGHIYCDKTGKLVKGGQISVEGPGYIFYIERGESGRYKFYTDGTPGIYTISYTHPDTLPMSQRCLPQSDTLNTSTADGTAIDRDGLINGIILLGSEKDGNYLVDKNCSTNTYYLNIDIRSGTDPFVYNNNIPVQCSSIGALTCRDNNFNSILDAGDTALDSIKLFLIDCVTTRVLDSTISIHGRYLFDGLSSGIYRIHAELPIGYHYALQKVGGNPLVDNDLDSLGYSGCITLNFGECDTTQAQICMIPNIYDLALNKTLADGQSVNATVGDTLIFNIKVKNKGSINAYDLDVVDEIPDNLVLIDNNWSLVGNHAVRRIPFLAVGDSTNVSIKTRVKTPVTSIFNAASVRGASRSNGPIEAESNLINNRDSVRFSLRACTFTPNFEISSVCALTDISFSAIGRYISWAWDFGDGSTSTLEQPTHEYQTAGNYTVTLMVTDSNGCSGSNIKQLTIHPKVRAYAGIDRTICKGDTVNLHAQGGTNYLWTADTSSLSNVNSANPIATPSVTTAYSVKVSDDYGCFSLDTVVVTVAPNPVIVSRTGDLSACSNSALSVRITIDQPISSYEITSNATWRNVVVNGNTITFDAFLNGSTNNMSVLLRGAFGCSVTDTFNLFLAGNPRADFMAIEPACDESEVTLLFTGQATTAATIHYNLDSGIIVRRSPATATRPLGDTTVVKFATFGRKLINLVVNEGGCIDETSKSVTVIKSSKTVISNNDTIICARVCVNLYGKAGALDSVYSWSPATGLSATNIPNPIACPLVTTTYYLTIMDANRCQGTDSVKIIVNNNIPTLVGIPANVTANCNNIPPPTTVTERYGAPVTFTEVRTNGNCPSNYTLTRTWMATDSCGNTVQAQQIITVKDNTAPVFTSIPANVTIECGDAIPNILATATDNCSVPTITVNTTTNGSRCLYAITRVFTATDACGNTAKATQIIMVLDTKAPIITSVPTNLTVDCSNKIPRSINPSVSDACDQSPRLTLIERTTDSTCVNHKTVIRTWTAADACGNLSTASQVISVLDNVKPVISPINPLLIGLNSGDTLTMNCENIRIFRIGDATATDNCSGNVRLTLEDVVRRRGNCLTDGYSLLLECRWVAVDDCGNQSEWHIFIKITDNKPPVFSDCPANITVASSSDVPTAPILKATDNCSDVVNVTMTETTTTRNNCYHTLTRTWTAVDGCGNFSTCSQLITVNDSLAVKEVHTNATCTNNDGTITMIPTQGLSYAWSDGASGPYRSRLKAGAYTVTASRGNTCQKVITVVVGDDCNCTPPVAMVQKIDATCSNTNGTATISVDNATNYTFSWSNGGSTTNTRTGLAAGNYTVTVTRSGSLRCLTVVPFTINNNTANCCTSFITQSSLVKVITDCNSKADVCVEIPSNSIASYTITDNGTTYSGGFGTCSAGSTLHFATGNHTVIFINPSGCKDTLLVKVTCSPEIVIHRTMIYPQTDSTCLTAAQLGLTGNIVNVVNDCAGRATFTTITIDPISKCIKYKALNLGVDTACLRIMTSTGGSAYVKFIITVTLPGCGSIIPQDSVTITDACSANPKVCVNIPYDVLPDYNILLNGTTYTGAFGACNNDTTFAYTYFTIPGRGATGPYSLDYWTVNGTTHTATTLNSMDDVVALMNIWDPTGHWMLSSSTLTIYGGDRHKTYGSIKLSRTINSSYGIMELNSKIIPMGTLLDIPRGHSRVVFINKNTGCADTLTINAACVTPQYIESTIYVGDKDTLCIATNELLGTRYRLTKLLPSTNTYVRFTDLSGTTCASRLGVAVGVEKATYVISDEYGINDTTYVTTHVYSRAVKRPKAVDDNASTIKAQPVLIDVLSNDSLNANSGKLTIVTNPKHGEVLVTSDMRIIYTPDLDYCNSGQADVFTYELCDIGGCDTAKVEVTVSCDKIKIFNAFSPNNDGINDFFVIEGIEKFPNNIVNVYNRWGTQVMNTKGYKNDWDGKWNNINLPDGTYFYIFEDGEGNKKIGYVQIQR